MPSPIQAIADLFRAVARFGERRTPPAAGFTSKRRWRVVVTKEFFQQDENGGKSSWTIERELFVYANEEYEVRPIVLSSWIQKTGSVLADLVPLIDWDVKSVELDTAEWKTNLQENLRPDRETRTG